MHKIVEKCVDNFVDNDEDNSVDKNVHNEGNKCQTDLLATHFAKRDRR